MKIVVFSLLIFSFIYLVECQGKYSKCLECKSDTEGWINPDYVFAPVYPVEKTDSFIESLKAVADVFYQFCYHVIPIILFLLQWFYGRQNNPSRNDPVLANQGNVNVQRFRNLIHLLRYMLPFLYRVLSGRLKWSWSLDGKNLLQTIANNLFFHDDSVQATLDTSNSFRILLPDESIGQSGSLSSGNTSSQADQDGVNVETSRCCTGNEKTFIQTEKEFSGNLISKPRRLTL